VKVPSWITLGQIISGIGGLLMFIGFIFGYLAVTNFQTSSGSGNINNFDGDLEGFFMITGFGVLLLVGGWLMHSVWPKFQARPRPAPVYPTPAPAAPAPEGMPQAPPPPQAAPAAPNCAKCGRPTTYIAQYGRYYCYTDNLYV
jgi:hypothetical protein